MVTLTSAEKVQYGYDFVNNDMQGNGARVEITESIKSNIWDCFDFDCDACVKEECKGCPLNIVEAK